MESWNSCLMKLGVLWSGVEVRMEAIGSEIQNGLWYGIVDCIFTAIFEG